MSTAPLPQRMNRLEEALAELALSQIQLHREMREFKDEMRVFKNEMLEFKDEMREFKNEMREFKNEMGEFKDEMRQFKDEMGEFKDEMRQFRDESERLSRNADRRMGELTNALGRLVEDIVGPSVPSTFRSLFGVEAVDTGIRFERRHPSDKGRSRELDAFAAGGDTFLVVEVKSTMRPEDVAAFVAGMPELREYFPEQAAGRRLVGAVASFHVHPSLVSAAERHGLLVFGLERNLIEVLNGPGFEPRAY